MLSMGMYNELIYTRSTTRYVRSCSSSEEPFRLAADHTAVQAADNRSHEIDARRRQPNPGVKADPRFTHYCMCVF